MRELFISASKLREELGISEEEFDEYLCKHEPSCIEESLEELTAICEKNMDLSIYAKHLDMLSFKAAQDLISFAKSSSCSPKVVRDITERVLPKRDPFNPEVDVPFIPFGERKGQHPFAEMPEYYQLLIMKGKYIPLETAGFITNCKIYKIEEAVCDALFRSDGPYGTKEAKEAGIKRDDQRVILEKAREHTRHMGLGSGVVQGEFPYIPYFEKVGDEYVFKRRMSLIHSDFFIRNRLLFAPPLFRDLDTLMRCNTELKFLGEFIDRDKAVILRQIARDPELRLYFGQFLLGYRFLSWLSLGKEHQIHFGDVMKRPCSYRGFVSREWNTPYPAYNTILSLLCCLGAVPVGSAREQWELDEELDHLLPDEYVHLEHLHFARENLKELRAACYSMRLPGRTRTVRRMIYEISKLQ